MVKPHSDIYLSSEAIEGSKTLNAMKIKEIQIVNFKGFEDRSFSLNDRFTVAIGNNGTGKSTLLHAIQVALGAFLQSMPTLPANYLYRRQFHRDQRFIRFDPVKKDYLPNDQNPIISVKTECSRIVSGSGQVEEIEWKREFLPRNATSHNTKHSRKIIEFAHQLYQDYKANLDVLFPVLSNFNIRRTSAQVKKVDKTWRKKSRLEKGYYAALGGTVDFTGVYEWLYNYENSIKDDKEFEGTRDAMFRAIRTAIPYIKDIQYNKAYGVYGEFEVLVDFEDGQSVERKLYSNLSDGMKAMLNVVAEIAYRCIMLNGRFGGRAVELSPGVVLIDEFDMHLHPNWQRHVVQDIKDAFPNIQFVTTTHSPFIVQSLEADELINLDGNVDTQPNDLSIDKVATFFLGVESPFSEQSQTLQDQSNTFLKQLDNGMDTQQLEVQLEEVSNPAVRAFLQLAQMAKGK